MNEQLALPAERPTADFSITIDYQKGQGNPSRVFRAMSDLIEAFQKVDETLISSIDSQIKPLLLLEDVEIGSIKSWFTQALESVDDGALGELNWKKGVGAYLVRGKRALINYMKDETTVTDASLEVLEGELVELATETDVKRLPSYEPVSRRALLEDIQRINQALEPLEAGDTATFEGSGEKASFSLTFSLTPETIEALIVSEVLQHQATMIMKVKSAVFIGDAMWQFHFENRTLDVKIEDTTWLKSFQNGDVPVLPGDAIRGRVVTKVEYGHDGDVVSTHHALIAVESVISKTRSRQGQMLHEGEGSGISMNRRDLDSGFKE